MAVLWAVAVLAWQIWVVVGQSYPSCSVGCVSAAVPSACNSTDSVCICQQVDQASLLSCLASSCGCTDQQSAAATFESTCASNGVQLTLNVACAAASSSEASSSGSATSSDPSTSAPTSSTDVATTVVASSTYTASAPAPASPTSTTSVQGSTVETVTSVSGGLSTSTAVVVFMSSDSTVVTFITSTHWYTTMPLSTSASMSSSNPSSTSSSSITTVVSVSQGSLISHGLATGAKAGIGAGAGAAVVAATVFSLWLFWFCRRKRRKTSSIAGSDHLNPSILPDVMADAPIQEKRLASLKNLQELPSETGSRKPTFSWGTASLATSSQQRPPSSEDDGFHHSVSAESGQHSPPIDQTAYQRPILGNDGCWHNAQELQGGGQSTHRAAPPAPANFEPLYLQKAQSRPIVPPGKWPPNSHGGFK